MIRILILDDDKEKTERIREVIGLIPEISRDNVLAVQDLIQARDACHKWFYDLLILDMRVPNRFGDPPEDKAGCDLSKIMQYNSIKTLSYRSYRHENAKKQNTKRSCENYQI